MRLHELAEEPAAEPSDGMHVMFGMVVMSFIMELLEKGKAEKLEKAFGFLNGWQRLKTR